MKEILRKLVKLIKLLLRGDFGVLKQKISFRLKQFWYFVLFKINCLLVKNKTAKLRVVTDFPIAYESLDHLHPWGTKNDNNTNRTFIIKINKILQRLFKSNLKFLDLGCAGGALVRDFKDFGYLSVGLEGSDYSLKHQRAEWKDLGNKNLFTADITKEFTVLNNEQPIKFHLITAWEVLEHIPQTELPMVFRNIIKSLEIGGYFVASTSSSSDMGTGVELHQTRLSNKEWKIWVNNNFAAELQEAVLPFADHEYVRFGGDSFLIYRKK